MWRFAASPFNKFNLFLIIWCSSWSLRYKMVTPQLSRDKSVPKLYSLVFWGFHRDVWVLVWFTLWTADIILIHCSMPTVASSHYRHQLRIDQSNGMCLSLGDRLSLLKGKSPVCSGSGLWILWPKYRSSLISGGSMLLEAQKVAWSTGMFQHLHRINKNLKM